MRQLLRDGDLAFVGHFLAGDHPEDRRLAGPVRADEADFLTRIELERGVDEQDLPAVLLADVGQRDHADVKVYRAVTLAHRAAPCIASRAPPAAAPDFLVGRLREIVVPLPHRRERLGDARTHGLVGDLASSWQLDGAPTGAATMTRAGACRRAASTAAFIVDPVASPSSTRITVRPRRSSSGRPCRYSRSRRSSSACSTRATASIARSGTPYQRTTSSFSTRTPPEAIAPIASRMSGQAQLSDQKNVERRIECLGHLEGHGHTAAWQRQHDHIVAAGIVTKLRRYNSAPASRRFANGRFMFELRQELNVATDVPPLAPSLHRPATACHRQRPIAVEPAKAWRPPSVVPCSADIRDGPSAI